MPSTSVRAGPAYSTPIVAAAHAAMSPGSAQGSSSSSAGPRQLTPDEDEDEDDREDMLGGDGEAYELREDIDWEKKRSRHGRGGQRRRRTSGDAANGGGDHEGDDAEGDGVGEVRKESDDEGKSSESESEADDEEGAWDPRSRRGFGRGPRRRPSVASTVMSFQLYTPDEERRVVRKFDRRLVLFVALLYMLSFLDRSSMCSPALRAVMFGQCW